MGGGQGAKGKNGTSKKNRKEVVHQTICTGHKKRRSSSATGKKSRKVRGSVLGNPQVDVEKKSESAKAADRALSQNYAAKKKEGKNVKEGEGFDCRKSGREN